MANSQEINIIAQFPYKDEGLVIIISSWYGQKIWTFMPYPNALTASGSKYKIWLNQWPISLWTSTFPACPFAISRATFCPTPCQLLYWSEKFKRLDSIQIITKLWIILYTYLFFDVSVRHERVRGPFFFCRFCNQQKHTDQPIFEPLVLILDPIAKKEN